MQTRLPFPKKCFTDRETDNGDRKSTAPYRVRARPPQLTLVGPVQGHDAGFSSLLTSGTTYQIYAYPVFNGGERLPYLEAEIPVSIIS